MSVCICILRHPACNAHALYYHLFPAPPYRIFLHYLMNGTTFEKKKNRILSVSLLLPFEDFTSVLMSSG